MSDRVAFGALYRLERLRVLPLNETEPIPLTRQEQDRLVVQAAARQAKPSHRMVWVRSLRPPGAPADAPSWTRGLFPVKSHGL